MLQGTNIWSESCSSGATWVDATVTITISGGSDEGGDTTAVPCVDDAGGALAAVGFTCSSALR